MRAPELAYSFNQPKDVSGPTLELFSRQLATTTATNPIQLAFSGIPKDKILIVTNLSLSANPGATQAVENMSVLGTFPAGIATTIEQNFPLQVADLTEALNWQGEVWIPGGDQNQLIFSATFDAAANPNFMSVHAYGLIVPRANTANF